LRARKKQAAQAAAMREKQGLPPPGEKPKKNGAAHP
jgi:hypothetical protein